MIRFLLGSALVVVVAISCFAAVNDAAGISSQAQDDLLKKAAMIFCAALGVVVVFTMLASVGKRKKR